MSRTVTLKVLSLATLFVATLTVAFAQVSFTPTLYDSGDYDTISIVTGDFNNDGILDLVTVNAETFTFYKGLGQGKYAVAVPQNLNLFFRDQVLAADFNRDGKTRSRD